MTYQTYALWGRGDLAPENATALLEEYIPDNVGTVYRPEVVDRQHQGLRTALAWFESPDFLGDGGALSTVDIVQSLTFDRDTQGDDVYLLALWPAEPTHEEFDFIESVQNSGITVFDLSRAMDELDLSLFSRPVPTTEEKAEARAEARAATAAAKKPRARKLSDDVPKEDPAPEITSTGSIEIPVVSESEEIVTQVLGDLFADGEGGAILAAIDAYVANKVIQILDRLRLEAEAKANDRPPFDGPIVDVDTRPYFFNTNTRTYREATGKPRRGEIVANLTEQEALDKMEVPF